MTDNTTLPFWFPAVRAKKLTTGFDGGRLSSDGGVMLLAQAVVGVFVGRPFGSLSFSSWLDFASRHCAFFIAEGSLEAGHAPPDKPISRHQERLPRAVANPRPF